MKKQTIQWRHIPDNEDTDQAMKKQTRQWRNRPNNEDTDQAMKTHTRQWRHRPDNEDTDQTMKKQTRQWRIRPNNEDTYQTMKKQTRQWRHIPGNEETDKTMKTQTRQWRNRPGKCCAIHYARLWNYEKHPQATKKSLKVFENVIKLFSTKQFKLPCLPYFLVHNPKLSKTRHISKKIIKIFHFPLENVCKCCLQHFQIFPSLPCYDLVHTFHLTFPLVSQFNITKYCIVPVLGQCFTIRLILSNPQCKSWHIYLDFQDGAVIEDVGAGLIEMRGICSDSDCRCYHCTKVENKRMEWGEYLFKIIGILS